MDGFRELIKRRLIKVEIREDGAIETQTKATSEDSRIIEQEGAKLGLNKSQIEDEILNVTIQVANLKVKSISTKEEAIKFDECTDLIKISSSGNYIEVIPFSKNRIFVTDSNFLDFGAILSSNSDLLVNQKIELNYKGENEKTNKLSFIVDGIQTIKNNDVLNLIESDDKEKINNFSREDIEGFKNSDEIFSSKLPILIKQALIKGKNKRLSFKEVSGVKFDKIETSVEQKSTSSTFNKTSNNESVNKTKKQPSSFISIKKVNNKKGEESDRLYGYESSGTLDVKKEKKSKNIFAFKTILALLLLMILSFFIIEQCNNTKTGREKPAKEKPAKEKPVKEKPVEEKPVEEKPVEEKPVEEKPVEEKPVEEKPTEDNEGVSKSVFIWFKDADGDGLGDPKQSKQTNSKNPPNMTSWVKNNYDSCINTPSNVIVNSRGCKITGSPFEHLRDTYTISEELKFNSIDILKPFTFELGDGNSFSGKIPQNHSYNNVSPIEIKLIQKDRELTKKIQIVELMVDALARFVINTPAGKVGEDKFYVGEGSEVVELFPKRISQGSYNHKWYINDSLFSEEINPSIELSKLGKYRIRLEVSNEYGGAVSSIEDVYVKYDLSTFNKKLRVIIERGNNIFSTPEDKKKAKTAYDDILFYLLNKNIKVFKAIPKGSNYMKFSTSSYDNLQDMYQNLFIKKTSENSKIKDSFEVVQINYDSKGFPIEILFVK